MKSPESSIDKKKMINSLSSCRRRVLIEKPDGILSVNCGHCIDCVTAKCNKYADLCEREMAIHRYTLFITLTYNDKYIPKCLMTSSFIDDREILNLIDITQRYNKDGTVKRNATYKQCVGRIQTCWSDEKFRKFFNQADTKSKLYKKDAFPVLRVLRKTDLQNFFKRLRKITTTQYDASFKYFAIGEYGSEYFRPHYHILLYFDSPELARRIRRLLRKAWQFGYINSSFVENDRACARYTASYLNSYMALPDFFTNRKIAPFMVHSRNFGTSYYSSLRDYVYPNLRRYLEAGSYKDDKGNVIDYWPTTSGLNSLFPRIYGFVNHSRRDLLALYTSFHKYSEKAKSDKVADIVKYLLTHNASFDCSRFLQLLDVVGSSLPHGRLNFFVCYTLSPPEYYASTPPPQLNDYDKRTYMRIYNVISISKHFLEFCCAKISPRDGLNLIIDYYNLRDQFNLKRQYQYMQSFYDEFSSMFDENSNESALLFGPDFYNIFYQIGGAFQEYDVDIEDTVFHSYQDLYDRHPVIKILNAEKDMKAQQKFKHRKQSEIHIHKQNKYRY